jgi:hypothetical protein
MNIFKTAAFAAMALAMGFTADAHATIITYDLDDVERPRLDLNAGFFQRGTYYTFDGEGAEATLTYDEAAGTVSITGKAVGVADGDTVDFSVQYNDVVRDGDSLTLNDMNTVGSFGDTVVDGKGFNLTLGDTLTGDGWLIDANTGEHFGDFHFAGTETTGNTPNGQVPVPSPLTLIAAMALFFGVWRRRRAVAA